jgi:nitroreductase / dihydropteridine reductase
MDIIKFAEKRYATKSFNSDLKIESEIMNKIESLLKLSPSSINTQPWHYIIAGSKEGKELIAESATDLYSYNKPKILNASHVIVFCTKTSFDEDYMEKLLDREEEEGRFKNKTAKEKQHSLKSYFADMHKYELKDSKEWMERQVYLAVGFFLMGAAALGVDTCPMEGFDDKILNRVLGLSKKGYEATVLAAIGYRNSDDFNAALPKSRLPEESVITRI